MHFSPAEINNEPTHVKTCLRKLPTRKDSNRTVQLQKQELRKHAGISRVLRQVFAYNINGYCLDMLSRASAHKWALLTDVIIIITTTTTLFQEENICRTSASVTYGPQLRIEITTLRFYRVMKNISLV